MLGVPSPILTWAELVRVGQEPRLAGTVTLMTTRRVSFPFGAPSEAARVIVPVLGQLTELPVPTVQVPSVPVSGGFTSQDVELTVSESFRSSVTMTGEAEAFPVLVTVIT